MASVQKNKRGRPRKPNKAVIQVADWQNVPVLCDAGMVAAILGKQNEAVRRMMADGVLPAFQIGKEWRIRKDKLMAHLGYLPWEIDHYGYGLPVDRAQRLQDELDGGLRVMAEIETGRAS